MGSELAKLFIDPATLPGGIACVNPLKACPGSGAFPQFCQAANHSVYYNGTYLSNSDNSNFLETLMGSVNGASELDYVDDLCSNTVGGFFQVMLLLVVYGAVLFKSADVLSEGSELLMFVPSIKDVVGSIVLPILGAVPDGAIVLFSGMGPIKEAQEQLNVGVGALAGSTIMLLTIPWFLSLWAGRVDLVNGSADATYKLSARKRLTKGWSLTETGISVKPIIRKNAWMMLATAFPCYFIIQVPAFIDGVSAGNVDPTLATDEHPFAIIGLVLCCVLFAYYLYFQANNEDTDAMVDRLVKDWLNGDAKGIGGSLSAILCDSLKGLKELKENNLKSRTGIPDNGLHATLVDASLQKSQAEDMIRLRTLIKPVFNKYDVDRSKRLDKSEFRQMMVDLNERPEEYLEDGMSNMSRGEAVDVLFQKWDTSHDDQIDFNEFCAKFYERIKVYALNSKYQSNTSTASIQAATKERDVYEDEDGDGDDDNEEEELPPDELLSETGEVDMAKLKKTAAISMFCGTLVVLVFSDPMVDVLSALGNLIGIPPFYISFVLAPLASNASELVASMNYAAKRTKPTITTSLSTLLGAANMNNTFCLAIFYALIVCRKGLQWTFSAETIVIVGVQVIMFFFAYQRTMKLWTAFVVLSFFPLSIVVVAFLESNLVGML